MHALITWLALVGIVVTVVIAWALLGFVGVTLHGLIRKLFYRLAERSERRAWRRMWQHTTYYVSDDWEETADR